MTVYWVDPTNGNNANAGTDPALPKKTITFTPANGDEIRFAKTDGTTYAGGLDFTINNATVNRNVNNSDDLTTVFAVGDVLKVSGSNIHYYVRSRTISSLTLNMAWLGATASNQSVTKWVSHKIAEKLFTASQYDRTVTITGGWDLSNQTQGSDISWVYNSASTSTTQIGSTSTGNNWTFSQVGFIQGNNGSWGIYGSGGTNTWNNSHWLAYDSGSAELTFYNNFTGIYTDCTFSKLNISSQCYNLTFTNCVINLGGSLFIPRCAAFNNCTLYVNSNAGDVADSIRFMLFNNCTMITPNSSNTLLRITAAANSIENIRVVIKGGTYKTAAGIALTIPVVASSTGFNHTLVWSHYIDYGGLSYVELTNGTRNVLAQIFLDSVTTRTSGSPSLRFDLYSNTAWSTLRPSDRIKAQVTGGTTYTVSAYLRKNSSYGSSNRPKITVYYDTDLGIYSSSTTMSDTNDTWVLCQVSVTPTNSGFIELDFEGLYASSGAKCWMADWSIVEA